MISDGVLRRLTELYGEYNYKTRLQDFTDKQFVDVYHLVKPKDWYDIEEYLLSQSSDPEVTAHLKGFDSAEERRQMIARFHELISEEQL